MIFGKLGSKGVSVGPLWFEGERGESDPGEGIKVRGYGRANLKTHWVLHCAGSLDMALGREEESNYKMED
jgi:hypothetical protein